MTVEPWRLKLERAELHLAEFEARIPPFQVRQVYPVSEGFETYQGQRAYVRRLRIPPINDPLLAVVAGDILFNCRSALDHLMMALVPIQNRTTKVVRATQFPIFICDVDEIDQITGRHLHGRDRGRWDRMLQGVMPEAIPHLKWFQPYQDHSQGRDPRDSSFAILSSLQNADKHRQLNLVTRGIRHPRSKFTLPDGTVAGMARDVENGFIGDGTVVDLAHTNRAFGG